MVQKISALLFLLSLKFFGFSQGNFWKKGGNNKWELPEVSTTKSGPYLGLQRGAYNVMEFGIEGQFKKIKLIKPVTHAFHMGFNYNFFRNVLGYDAGYWFKAGRLNLTYGLSFAYRTNFDQYRLGLIPAIGFKFTQLHLQTGVHLLTKVDPFFPTNTFFISLRFVLINNRDIKVN